MTESDWRRMFGFRLRRYLNETNMTQSELADKIFVTRGTVNNYLSGRVAPSIKVLVNISVVFGCYVRDLIDFGDVIE